MRAAVIGSGFGGLALAIRLQASGFPTVLFEKRDQAGGRAYVYHDQGFTFGYFGYSTAVALVLTLIVSALALLQLSIWRSREVVA